MDADRNYQFHTDRLVVDEWHKFENVEDLNIDLAQTVQDILSDKVTRSLPPPWQGEYSHARATAWIADRDKEGVTLLAIGRESNEPVALVILFFENEQDLRLGYMLSESSWGKGYGSELINGLTNWCRSCAIQSITGGVASDNPASARVLEKNGFELIQATLNEPEQLYKWTL